MSAKAPLRETLRDWYEDFPVTFWSVLVVFLVVLVVCVLWWNVGVWILSLLGVLAVIGGFIFWVCLLVEEWDF